MTKQITQAVARGEFKPIAVVFTDDAVSTDRDGEHVDPTLCTLLHLDSTGNSGWLYTREEWESGAEPRIERSCYSRGQYEGLRDGERIELLPDMVIVKLEERDYWYDPVVLDHTTSIYAVYAIDRRVHAHLCSFDANYEAYYLGTQYDSIEDLSDQESAELWDRIQEGALANEPFSYFGVALIDRILKNTCREGDTPANGQSGGYKLEVTSVITADAYTELCEAYGGSEL